MDKKTIDKIKEENAGKQLYLFKCSYLDETSKTNEKEFIYRAPTIADYERFNTQVRTNLVTAQRNLFVTLVLGPDKETLVSELVNKPLVITDFIDKAITPFFGTEIQSENVAL